MQLLHLFVPSPQSVLTSLPCLLRACAPRVEEVWEEESSVAIFECVSDGITAPDLATLFSSTYWRSFTWQMSRTEEQAWYGREYSSSE